MTDRFSDKSIRQKPHDKLSAEELALVNFEISRAKDNLLEKYRGEPETILKLAQALRDEAGRQLYAVKPVTYGDSETSLFDEGNR